VREAQDADALELLLAERGTQLMRTAVLLAGGRQDGEDLLQAALERLIRQGRRITGNPEGYLRRTLYNLAADRWRRRETWRRKLPVIGAGQREIAHELTAAVDLLAYTRQTSQGVKLFVAIPHGRPTEVRASVIQTWSRGLLERVEVVTGTGKPALGMQIDTRPGKSIQTTVSYPKRVWWRGTYQPPAAPKSELGCTLGQIDRTPAQWAREVRKLLSCGAAVAGHERVDGVNAIKLRLSSSCHRACASASDQRRCQPQRVGWTGGLWANASTYLPVRLVSHGQRYRFQVDFRWLAPSAANLARLHQPIPAGFRHV